MRILLLGATGLVGRHVLDLALTDDRIAHIIAPTRSQLATHPKLYAPIVDFEQIDSIESWGRIDAVICALGTTMKKAGSEDTFYRVDHDYPLLMAHLAFKQGARIYVLNSATGASTQSKFFYNQVKGKLQNSLQRVGFTSLTFVQPALIGGKRDEFRFGESMMSDLLGILHPFLPKTWQINPAQNVASALLESALDAKQGCSIISSDQLVHQDD